MARTTMLVRFNEAHDYEHPVDDAGNVAPFAPPAGLTMPVSVDGIVGRARRFSPTTGLIATEFDPVAAPTRLVRDLTIEAIVNLPWATTNGTYRLVTRGRGDAVSDDEREMWGLQVVVSGAPGAPVVQLQARWEKSTGAAATVPAVTIVPPAGWLSLAATRRWISATSVLVDYYVNGEHMGQVSSSDGDLADGLAGSVLIGIDGALAGMPANSYIDDVRVTSDARSAEELRQIYRRSFVFPGYGYDLMRSLMPPGDSWSQNEDSRIQRFFRVAGDGLALAWAKAAELLDDYLPDRAWAFLDRWETVLRLSPKFTDTLETRRARVVAFLRKVQGYSREKLLDAVADLLDADAVDLELIEYSAEFLDPFTAALGTRWVKEAGGTLVFSGTVSGGKIDIDVTSGKDIRWDGSNSKAARIRLGIPGGVDFMVGGGILYPVNFNMDGIGAGIFILNITTGDALLFGAKRISGTIEVWARSISGGVATDFSGVAAMGASAHFLIRRTPDGLASLGYREGGTGYDPSTFTTMWSGIVAPVGASWAGMFLSGDTNPTSGLTSGADLSEFYIRDLQDPHVFGWAIYRDPALGGAPDISGAQLLLEKLKPAHTKGGVTQARTALYDNEFTAYDRTPGG